MGLEVLIVGSGLAGLAAAAFLRKHHSVTLLEKTSLDFSRNDYGISVIANAYNLLQKAGIDDSNLDMAVMTHLWQRTNENQEIFTMDFDTRKTFGAPSVLTRRSRLQAELYRLATSAELEGKPAKVVEGVRVARVDATAGVVSGSDGQTYRGDLVIGADGINSVVRGAVTSADGESSTESAAATHDLLAYMAVVSVSVLQSHPDLDWFSDPTEKAGLVSWYSPQGRSDKRRILAYHFSPRDFALVGYAPEEEFSQKFEQTRSTIIKGVPSSRVEAAFPDFSKSVTDLFQHHSAGDGTVEAWHIRDIDPLDQWSRGKTLLIGDAAHAITPHAGQGCNVAFEDAEALGYLLKDAQTAEDVPVAISKFLELRKARAQDIAQASRHMGGILGPKDAAALGEFDQRAFQKRTYGYTGAEAALKQTPISA